MTSWPQKLHTLFGKKLTQKEVNDWEEEIRHYFDGNVPTGEEIIEVLRWRSAPHQPDIKHTSEINMKALRIWICMFRRDQRTAYALPEESCAMCQHGWIVYEKKDGHKVSIPCCCSVGKRILEQSFSEEEWDDMRNYAEIAIHQEKERLRYAQEILDKGLRLADFVVDFEEKPVADLVETIDGLKYGEDER
jgi:hypothetical protein